MTKNFLFVVFFLLISLLVDSTMVVVVVVVIMVEVMLMLMLMLVVVMIIKTKEQSQGETLVNTPSTKTESVFNLSKTISNLAF